MKRIILALTIATLIASPTIAAPTKPVPVASPVPLTPSQVKKQLEGFQASLKAQQDHLAALQADEIKTQQAILQLQGAIYATNTALGVQP